MTYLTVQDLALYIHRSPGAVRNLVLCRAISYRKPGGRLLFDKEEVDQWIRSAPGVSMEDLPNESTR